MYIFRKLKILLLALVLIFYTAEKAFSLTHTIYVDPGATPAYPYSNTSIACTTVQAAIDAIAVVNGGGAADYDLVSQANNFIILIRNSTYNEGTNRIQGYTTSSAYDIMIMPDPGHSPVIQNTVVFVSNEWVTIEGLEIDGGAMSLSIDRYFGIEIKMNNVTVHNCEVYNVYNSTTMDTGIYIDALTYENVNIIGNILYANGGGIRTKGTSTVMMSNVCYNSVGDGIRSGSTGTNVVIAQNRCYSNGDNGITIRGFSDISRIFNNLIYNNIGHGIEVEGTDNGGKPAIRFRVFQNTIYNNGGSGIFINAGAGSANVELVAIFNNLITHNIRYGVEKDDSQYIITYDAALGGVDYNDAFANGMGDENIGGAWGANNINADPLYLSVDPANIDFLKIDTASPCIDRGGDSSAYGTWPNDFWGDPRPYDHPLRPNPFSIYDIGCDEFFVLIQTIHHFEVWHDHQGFVGLSEKFTVSAKNSNNFTIQSNIGIVTIWLDSPGGTGNITWVNGGNCGNFTNYITHIMYEFLACDNGVVTFYITDDTVDTLDIEVVSTVNSSITDTGQEGFLYIDNPVDIRISKTVIFPAGQPYPGDLVTYRIDWTNAGIGIGRDVKITDTIPNNTIYSAETMSNESGTLTDAVGDDAGALSGNTLVFCPGTGVSSPSDGGLVNPGDSGSFYFSVVILSSAGITNYQTNIIFEDDFDTTMDTSRWDSGGGTATSPGLAGSLWALQILQNGEKIKSADLTGISNVYLTYVWDLACDSSGDELRIRIKTNNGPNDIRDQIIDNTPETTNTILLPSYVNNQSSFTMEFVESYGGVGDVGRVDNVKLFYIDTIPPGDPPDKITNNITVSGSNLANVNTNLITTLQPPIPANIVLTKTVVSPAGIPAPEDYIRYRIDYTNTGTDPAIGVIITDPLPAGTVYSQGSIWVNGSQMSDIAGDDEASYSNSVLTFCPVGGTAPGGGGTVPSGASGSIFFTIQVATNTPPDFYVVWLTNDPTYDREIETNNGGAVPGWDQNAITGTTIRAGDSQVLATELWGFVVGVDISSIPSEANITSATQYLYMTDAGQEPWEVDPFKVDYISVAQSNIASLGHADVYTLNGIENSFYTFTWPGDAPFTGYYGIPCPNQVKHASTNSSSAALDFFQTRYKATLGDGNGDNDMMVVNSADNAANKPYLKVYYELGGLVTPTAVTNIVNVTGANITNRSSTLVTIISQSMIASSNVQITKSISNVMLGGASSEPIPGATITYKINYNNVSGTDASNALIYDQLPGIVTYYEMDSAAGWTNQYTANGAPDQSFGSIHYSNAPVGPSANPDIRWIRWKKDLIPTSESGIMIYKVIIK